MSNEEASQNEGAPNEGAQVSEGDFEHSPIIGGIFRYSEGDGPPRRVRVLKESTNKDGEYEYSVSDEEGNNFETARHKLIPEDTPDVASIPQTHDQYVEEAKLLSAVDLKHVLEPQIISPDQQQLLSIHHKLDHLPFPHLFKMAEKGIIPKILAYLKHRPPVCASCIFGRC